MRASDSLQLFRRLSMRLALTGVVLVTACVQADVLRMDGSIRPQTQPQSIRVLATEPSERYAVIALVSVSSGDRDVYALRQRLIQEAARLGGQAVLLDAQSLARLGDRRVLSAKVIVFERSPQ